MGHVRVGNKEIHGSPAAKVAKVTALVLMGIIGAAILAIVFGLVIQWLWNQVMPDIFGLPEISYWQAVGIVVLSHILFGGHHHGSSHHPSRKKAVKAKSEVGGESISHDMEWDSFREFWKEHGRDAFTDWLHGRDNSEE